MGKSKRGEETVYIEGLPTEVVVTFTVLEDRINIYLFDMEGNCILEAIAVPLYDGESLEKQIKDYLEAYEEGLRGDNVI